MLGREQIPARSCARQGVCRSGRSRWGWLFLAAVPGTLCGQWPACPALLAGSCWVPSSGFVTPVTFTSWAAALEPGVCVCLLFHCDLAVVSSSPPRSMAVGSLLSPLWVQLCKSSACFPAECWSHLAACLGWDDGLEMEFPQKEHPSGGLEDWEVQVEPWWLRMEPSHRHGGVSSGDLQKTFLGHFSATGWFWRRGGFHRDVHPVLPGGTRWRRRLKDLVALAGLGAKGLPPTAVMSLQVSAPSTRSCDPRARQWGWGSLEPFPAEPGADPTFEP